MNFFNTKQKIKLARSLVAKTAPAYVQFYITSRCNLTCEQCNIIYADADAEEMTIDQIRKMAENLSEIGVCIVLLIGGEPFVRKDLPEIVKAFTDADIHVRMQTNGLASRKKIEECIAAGGHDISISLDSLNPQLQEKINGGYSKSWDRAIDTIAMINELFPENGTAFFNSVLMPQNMSDIADVVKFGSKIGWGTSIVPAHVTTPDKPRGFRAFSDDTHLKFADSEARQLRHTIDELKKLKKSGELLYDSEEYLDDIYRFLMGEEIEWRRRNENVCDSPNLYFAIAPNGNMKVCCDFELDQAYSTYSPEFPKKYWSGEIHENVYRYTRACDGCMYGSYPEITISARYFKAMLERFVLFNVRPPKLQKFSATEMKEIAQEILLNKSN